MINLLPPTIKEDMFYGRRNTIIRKWIIACIIALAGTGVIVGAGYLYLEQTIRSETSTADQARTQLESQKVNETQARLNEISGNTKLITQVLSREVLFSKLLRQLGAALPANTILTGLQIDQIQGGLTLQAVARDTEAATQLQVNLQDPKNGIFENADLERISCSETESENSQYPCTVQLRALFGKNGDYTYISSQGSGSSAKP